MDTGGACTPDLIIYIICIIGSSRGPTPGSDRMDTGGACTPDLMGEKGNI